MPDPQGDLMEAALEAAQEAGRAALRHFRRGIAVSHKPDGSPVSEADLAAERITQLGGEPDLNPAVLAERSHTEYAPGKDLPDMIREDLVAERIAIATYSEIVRWLGDADPTTRRLLEHRTREIEALGQIAQAGLTAATPEVLVLEWIEPGARTATTDEALGRGRAGELELNLQ